jgi:hypothetical protein
LSTLEQDPGLLGVYGEANPLSKLEQDPGLLGVYGEAKIIIASVKQSMRFCILLSVSAFRARWSAKKVGNEQWFLLLLNLQAIRC